MVIMMRERIVTPRTLVDISALPELSNISYDDTEGLTIGATATHLNIERDPQVSEHYPSLKLAFHTIGNVRVRSAGTLGGNLAYAEPQCNPPTILAALDAKVHLLGPGGKRDVPAEEFVRGIFESALEPGEIITHVTVPPPRPGSRTEFRKFTARSETDKPTAVVAVNVVLDAQGGRVTDCRIVVGAVGPKAYRCREAEELVKGARETRDIDLAAVAAKAKEEFEVIEDANGPEWFKKQITAVIIGELLERAMGLAPKGGD